MKSIFVIVLGNLLLIPSIVTLPMIAFSTSDEEENEDREGESRDEDTADASPLDGDQDEDKLRSSDGGSGLSTYENPDIGIRFEYPSQWETEDVALGFSFEHPSQTRNPMDGFLGFSANLEQITTLDLKVFRLSDLGPSVTSLEDFARYQYRNDESADLYTSIDDNQTRIGKNNYSALQMEYKTKGGNQGLTIWTVNGGVGYEFQYLVPAVYDDRFSKNIPEIRKMMDSVEFIPFPSPERPSFMN